MLSRLISRTPDPISFAWDLLDYLLIVAPLGLLSASVFAAVVAGLTGDPVVNFWVLWLGCTAFWITLDLGKSFITELSMMSLFSTHSGSESEEDSSIH